MTDTPKTNEEIAYAIITEPNDHMGLQRIIEALDTKDRERDEAVAEAVDSYNWVLRKIIPFLEKNTLAHDYVQIAKALTTPHKEKQHE